MEESFSVRRDKIFGSLSSSSASSSSLSSLWCLADDEIDRNERTRAKEVYEPLTGLFDSKSFPDIRIQESETEDEGKSSDYNEEMWEIKSSIGMDSTLDMEEEEDENDKLAVGEDLYGYTEDLNGYETEADDWEELTSSLNERDKDSRANHIAAKIRLQEDAEAVNKLNSLHVSEVLQDDMSMSINEEALVVSGDGHVGSSGDSMLKPILKRNESHVDSKLQKRVRFSSDTRDDNGTGGDEDLVMETSSPNENLVQPDYMLNPSKYTRYSFDEGEVDEESNRKAYMGFLNMIRSRDEPLEDPLVELPRTVAFVPKRKPLAETERKVENIDKGCEGRRGAVAVFDTIEDNAVSAMEEDKPEKSVNVTRGPGRQYRTRAKEDEENC